MIKLVINELQKIFLRKNVYILMAAVVAFILYSNYTISSMENKRKENENKNNNPDISFMEKELIKIDLDKYPERYIILKNTIDSINLMNKYSKESWQYNYLTTSTHYKYINNVNEYTYGKNKNEEKLLEAGINYDSFVEKLDNNQWKESIEQELTYQKKNLEDLKSYYTKTGTDIGKDVAEVEIYIESLELRLSKNINFDNGYLDKALQSYSNHSKSALNLDLTKFRYEYVGRQQLQAHTEEIAISKYTIENNINALSKGYHTSLTASIFEQYDIFILILILLISGGIVSEEFSKGTIKLLLIRPHSRYKILLSKYITVIIMIFLSYFVIAASQIIAEGLISGYSDFNVNVAVYNFNTYKVSTYNVVLYSIIDLFNYLPILIILTTLSFAISSVFMSTTLGIILPVIGLLGGNAINSTAMARQIINLKYFITLNWDFPMYMNGRLPKLEGLTWQFSLILFLVYFGLLMFAAFYEFKNKNIKNI